MTRLLGWILALSFIALTLVPRLCDDIMFVDGIIYAAISRNMAQGNGTFWEPQFLSTVWPSYNQCAYFCDHPPLMFFMESLFFQILPDTSLVENLYNLIILILLIFLIVKLWNKLLVHSPELLPHSWLPALCWYALRTVWWSIPNNLLDTSMTVFCLLSCLSQLRLLTASTRREEAIGYLFSGTFALLAFLTKGPVGLYPLVFLAIYPIVYGQPFVSGLSQAALIFAVFSVEMGLLLCYPPARQFLAGYVEGQVFQSLMTKRENLGHSWTSHFFLIKMLSEDILPHLAGLTVLIILTQRLKVQLTRNTVRTFLFTLLIAFSGILPMLVSKKQGASYMMPALPLLGISIAVLYSPYLNVLLVQNKALVRLAMASVIGLCTFGTVVTFKNSEQAYLTFFLNDLGKYVPAGRQVAVSEAFYNDSYVPAYFQRVHKLSPVKDWKKAAYILTDSTLTNAAIATRTKRLIWKDNSGIFKLYAAGK